VLADPKDLGTGLLDSDKRRLRHEQGSQKQRALAGWFSGNRHNKLAFKENIERHSEI